MSKKDDKKPRKGRKESNGEKKTSTKELRDAKKVLTEQSRSTLNDNFLKLDDEDKPGYILRYIRHLEFKSAGEVPRACKEDIVIKKGHARAPNLDIEKQFQCAFAKFRIDHGLTVNSYPIPGYDIKRPKKVN